MPPLSTNPATKRQTQNPAASPSASASASASSNRTTTNPSRRTNPSSSSTAPKSSRQSKRPLQKPSRPLVDPRTAHSVPAHVKGSLLPPLLSDDEYDDEDEGSSGDGRDGRDEAADESDDEMASSAVYPRKDWSRAMPKDFDSRHEPSLFLDAAYAARRIEALKAMRGASGGDGASR